MVDDRCDEEPNGSCQKRRAQIIAEYRRSTCIPSANWVKINIILINVCRGRISSSSARKKKICTQKGVLCLRFDPVERIIKLAGCTVTYSWTIWVELHVQCTCINYKQTCLREYLQYFDTTPTTFRDCRSMLKM